MKALSEVDILVSLTVPWLQNANAPEFLLMNASNAVCLF